jgi:hypothetical protein
MRKHTYKLFNGEKLISIVKSKAHLTPKGLAQVIELKKTLNKV